MTGSPETGSNQLEPKGVVAGAGPGPLTKRAFDLCLSLFLTPFAVILLIPFVVALKVTSNGPVLFRQTRYGYGKRRFAIFKLRTLTVAENDADMRQVVAGDARLTKLGAFLRRTSLDEVPQLLNVLRGEMSLVGPRPHPTHLDDTFGPQIPNYDGRFLVRPGITGLAQVRGYRGPTPTVEIMAKRIKSDLEYAATRSFWGDIALLTKTISVVLSRKNAI